MSDRKVPLSMREKVAEEHALDPEDKIQRIGENPQTEEPAAHIQRRLKRRKPVETATGLGGITLIHEPRSVGSREPICETAELHELRLRDVRGLNEDAEPCSRCTALIEAQRRMEREIEQETVAADGGTQTARPAATVETSVPGVTEPVELQPWHVAAVVGGAAIAGGLVGAALAGR